MKKIHIILAVLLCTTAQAQLRESVCDLELSDWAGVPHVENNVATVDNGETVNGQLVRQEETSE